MKIFLDSGNVEEIKKFFELGVLSGVTTNPSLMSKNSGSFGEIVSEICAIASPLDVSVEVTASDCEGMLAQAERILRIAENITIKLPITEDGLKACSHLSKEKIRVNMTLCFSAMQALLAARAGAHYVSPFIGRLDDIGANGVNLIADIREIFDQHPDISTKILAASIRGASDALYAAKAGADIATLPAATLQKLIHHPLTSAGLAIFEQDWQKSGMRIE